MHQSNDTGATSSVHPFMALHCIWDGASSSPSSSPVDHKTKETKTHTLKCEREQIKQNETAKYSKYFSWWWLLSLSLHNMMDMLLLKCFRLHIHRCGRQRCSECARWVSTEMRMDTRNILWKCIVVGRMRKCARHAHLQQHIQRHSLIPVQRKNVKMRKLVHSRILNYSLRIESNLIQSPCTTSWRREMRCLDNLTPKNTSSHRGYLSLSLSLFIPRVYQPNKYSYFALPKYDFFPASLIFF